MTNKILMWFLLLAVTQTCLAITDQERDALYRLQSELKSLNAIVGEAQRASKDNSRFKVNYRQLLDDLEQIQQGIQAILSSERQAPRQLPSIKGEYQ